MPENSKARLVEENQALQARIAELEHRLDCPSPAPALATDSAHHARLTTLGEMASTLAHELSQPLAAIQTYARAGVRLVKTGGTDADELLHALDQIVAQAGRACTIIARLRRFLAPRQAARLPSDLNELVREAVLLCEPELRQHGVAVQLKLADSLPPVLVDRVQIEQVIVNLTRNAVEAMADTPPVERALIFVTQTNEQAAVQLDVCDAGSGLSVETIRRLFEPFQTTKPDGLGLGLALGRSIVQSHGGLLWAKANPGCGATFSFALPFDSGGKDHGQSALRVSGR